MLGIDRDLDVVAHGDTGMCRHGSAVGIGQRDLVFPGVEMPRWFSPAVIWREAPMICLEDLIGFCDLTPDEVHAIAEHEHIADAIAAVLGASMLRSKHGPEHIRDMFLDDIRTAVRRHDVPHARHLVSTLRHFLHEHPEAAMRQAA